MLWYCISILKQCHRILVCVNSYFWPGSVNLKVIVRWCSAGSSFSVCNQMLFRQIQWKARFICKKIGPIYTSENVCQHFFVFFFVSTAYAKILPSQKCLLWGLSLSCQPLHFLKQLLHSNGVQNHTVTAQKTLNQLKAEIHNDFEVNKMRTVSM